MQIFKRHFTMTIWAILLSLVLLYIRLSFVSYCCGLICPLNFAFFASLLIAFGFLLYSVVILFKQITKTRILNVFILLVTVVVIFSVDIETIRKQYFVFRYDLYQEYTEAMTAVRTPWNFEKVQNLNLSDRYKSLSACNGSILLKEDPLSTTIFFYNLVDWYSFSGYLYTSNGELPDQFFRNLSLSTQEICADRINPNWYYCQHDD